jgi:glycosyltransferase involved in cell wall biosynthesis
MALGRVVVGSDLPAIQELIINGETGLLAPPGDASAFTTAVERVLYDQGLRSEISIAAKQWVSQNRTWPRIALQYRDLYARLTQR